MCFQEKTWDKVLMINRICCIANLFGAVHLSKGWINHFLRIQESGIQVAVLYWVCSSEEIAFYGIGFVPLFWTEHSSGRWELSSLAWCYCCSHCVTIFRDEFGSSWY
jgi:hypothetical protein